MVKQLFNEMKIDKCKTSSSRGLTNQPSALGRVFVVVVAVVVLVVAFLAGRSASCDEAGAVSGETDNSKAGSFLHWLVVANSGFALVGTFLRRKSFSAKVGFLQKKMNSAQKVISGSRNTNLA